MESNLILANSDLEPREDMEFDSNEAAYAFYKDYAKAMGFGTSKVSSRRSRASKEFIDAKFSCYRYGNKQQSDDAVNPRPSPKIGCKASLHVKRKPDGKWYVYNFVKDHNHELLPAQAHFFRSHRDVDPVNSDVRMHKRKILASVSRHSSAYQNVECLESYIRNQHVKGQKLTLESGDAQLLVEIFMNMQEENPKFFYTLDLNEEHQLRNVFWVDAKGIDNYAHFGDVVSLDTTYITNKYKVPLVLFVGVNHHMQPTLLGSALLADETVYTYVWLMQTWLIAMGGRLPNVILADQNDSLKAAIAAVLHGTRHCFSLWHVMESIPKQLGLSLGRESFLEKFSKCIYLSWTEDQFEQNWWKLLDEFQLQGNEWMQSLYKDRFHWAPLFIRGVSFAGLSMAARSDSSSSFFDHYISEESSLKEFLEQYKALLEDMCEEEAKAEFDAWHETPEFRSPSPFEKQMFLVYTHEIFGKFQNEVLGAAACHIKKEKEDDVSTIYSVKEFEVDQDFIVEWNETKSEICCSCLSFEFRGYLCRHAIVVLQMSGAFSIPSRYILQRWTNAAKSKHGIGENLDQVQTKVRRFNDLCRRAVVLSEEGSLSDESFLLAASSIKEALQQCANLNNSAKMDSRLNLSYLPSSSCNDEDSHGSHSRPDDGVVDPQVNYETEIPRRPESGKGISADGNVHNIRGKAPQEQEASASRAHEVLPHMELTNTRLMNLQHPLPVQFHSMVPSMTMFQGMTPTQLHNVPLHDKHIP